MRDASRNELKQDRRNHLEVGTQARNLADSKKFKREINVDVCILPCSSLMLFVIFGFHEKMAVEIISRALDKIKKADR